MFIKLTFGTASFMVFLCTSALAQVTHPETGETLSADQTFTFRLTDTPETIDPGLVEDTGSGDVVRNTHEGLYTHDAEGNVVPGVALSHTVSDDGLVYTFALRSEARWSNGDPVTAGDFVYSWRRVADPETGSPYSWYLELMGIANANAVIEGTMTPDQLGMRAVDDRTLEVTLNAPLPYFDQMVTHWTALPVHQATVEAHGADWVQPENTVSNGAYTVTEYDPGRRLVLSRNPQYWDDADTIIETVEVLAIADQNQALTRYLVGELDRVEVPAGQFPRLLEEHPTEVMSFPELCTYYYSLNLRPEGPQAFKDQRVREALSLAIDRDIITGAVTAKGHVPAYTLTHWATAGWTAPEVPAAVMTQEERNARAQALMAEAGYGEGGEPLTFEVLYDTSETHKAIGLAVSQMWKQTLGVEATLANQEAQTFWDAAAEGAFEVAKGDWCGDYNEPSTFLDLMQSDSGYNEPQFSDVRLDEVLAEARTAIDPLPLYQEAETIISTELPVLPLFHYAGAYMLNDAVKGWPVNNVQQTWYARDLYRVMEE